MKKLTLDDLHNMRNHSNKIAAIKALRDGRSEVFGLGDAKLIVETLQGTVAYPHTTCSAIKCLVDYIERTTAEDAQDRIESLGAPVGTCVPVPEQPTDEDSEIQVLAKVTELLLGLRQTSNDAAVRVARYIDARFND